MLLALVTPAVAQRVQFPSTAQPTSAPPPYPPTSVPYTVPGTSPPPTYTSPPPSTTPLPSESGSGWPYTPSSPYTPPTAPGSGPTVAPPPAFDPYASGSPQGPPPASVPYTYTPTPPPPTDFSQQPAPLYPEGLPYGWEPGVPAYPGEESYWQKTQRFLQELSAEYTFLYGDPPKPRNLEINRLELTSTFAVPMFYNVETPLLVTPGFAFNWLGGPPNPYDLPPRVYDAYLDFAWYPRVSPWLGAELGFRTGVWSDFDHVDSDAVRFLGRGLATVSLTPTLDILFGAVYLDRAKVKILPAGGVYWRPTPEWDAYIVFPNPKVRKSWFSWGNAHVFWYAAGEYGGGSWSVERLAGPDRIDINDIRAIGGIEWETITKIRGYIEVGYVFDREVVFTEQAPIGDYGLHDTVMVRGGIDF